MAFALLAFQAYGQSITGRVVGVHDGDTITVLDGSNVQHRIRLAGIDAPEAKQAFGTKAKQALSGMVFGKEVRVEGHGGDKYGRTLGDVVAGGTWVNRTMVEAGMAWHYVAYFKDKELADAEKDARVKRLGLWSDIDPTPPWEFRKETKSK
jgi:endonuclease YncB( thermonuclease family)